MPRISTLFQQSWNERDDDKTGKVQAQFHDKHGLLNLKNEINITYLNRENHGNWEGKRGWR